jgi:hypothetical protein
MKLKLKIAIAFTLLVCLIFGIAYNCIDAQTTEYMHLVRMNFKGGHTKDILVQTKQPTMGDYDIDTYRESNPRFQGYIDVYHVEVINTKMIMIPNKSRIDDSLIATFIVITLILSVLCFFFIFYNFNN